MAAKGSSPRALVIAGGDEGDVPEQALVDLLCGPLGIGAVVPLLCHEHGRVAEAGTFSGPGGAVVPFNAGAALAAPEHSFRRDVPGTAFVGSGRLLGGARWLSSRRPWRPTRRCLFVTCSSHIGAKGLRIVYEPSWRVAALRGVLAAPGAGGAAALGGA